MYSVVSGVRPRVRTSRYCHYYILKAVIRPSFNGGFLCKIIPELALASNLTVHQVRPDKATSLPPIRSFTFISNAAFIPVTTCFQPQYLRGR